MSATATEAPTEDPVEHPAAGSPSPERRRCRGALALVLAALLTGCAEEPLPQRQISRDDCLSEVRIDQLKEAIGRCDKVVAAFPRDPLPLNERFLLHILAENDRAACRDILQAAKLAKAMPAARLDAVLRRELELRQADCRDAGLGTPANVSGPATGTPLPAPPGAATAGPAAAGSPAVQKLPHQNR